MCSSDLVFVCICFPVTIEVLFDLKGGRTWFYCCVRHFYSCYSEQQGINEARFRFSDEHEFSIGTLGTNY